MESFKQKVRALKLQTYALYFAYRDPRVPWYTRAFLLLVVAYAFSPIDLIPDFIPVLGYLDDFILIPLGVALAVRLIPAAVMAESLAAAQAHLAEGKPQFCWMGAVIIAVWLLVITWMAWLIVKASR